MDWARDLNKVLRLFQRLRPSLRRLTLRIRSTHDTIRYHPQSAVESLCNTFATALLGLPHLHTLAIGGTGIDTSLMRQLAASSTIEDLTLLPTGIGFADDGRFNDCRGIQELVAPVLKDGGYPRLRRLEVHLTDRAHGSGSSPLGKMFRAAEARGVEVHYTVEDRGWHEFWDEVL